LYPPAIPKRSGIPLLRLLFFLIDLDRGSVWRNALSSLVTQSERLGAINFTGHAPYFSMCLLAVIASKSAPQDHYPAHPIVITPSVVIEWSHANEGKA